ncbi:MAG: anaerobic ribonucleoside-triphosphate reductase activating protein [Clostridia bacterium]|nr:anaerobic ribonucleoside-triphosphate reductase activating protein [Clostridia bacterium]
MELRIAGIEEESIVDGRGIRNTVFTQGCPHHCPGCHNPETHDFEGGRIIDTNEIFEDFKENPLLKGITFSGGEPFMQPEPLADLADKVHSIGKDVTCYTGFTYEELIAMNREDIMNLLDKVDYLIDGKFILEQKNLELRFRGSENQRFINMKETREKGYVITEE